MMCTVDSLFTKRFLLFINTLRHLVGWFVKSRKTVCHVTMDFDHVINELFQTIIIPCIDVISGLQKVTEANSVSISYFSNVV